MAKKNKIIRINPLLHPLINPIKPFNIVYGGRGSGKSWGIADILLMKAISEKCTILCVKGTMVSISDSVKEVIEKGITRHELEDYFYITDREIVCKSSGSRFIFYGLLHAERLKSIEGCKYLWIEEANVDVTSEALSAVLPVIIRNPGHKIFMTFNPKNVDDVVYKDFILQERDDTTKIFMNYYNNPTLQADALEFIANEKKRNYTKYMWEYEGQIKINEDEALFKFDDLNILSDDVCAKNLLIMDRIFEKIVVAIDPSGSAHGGSDACGIMVVGRYAGSSRYAVIEDQTAIMKSSEWGAKAVYLYNKYSANEIIYESNFGGEMVETVIKSVDRYINPKPVRATKSKLLRAEPIQALYEQGVVDHFSGLSMLEGEMTSYTGDKKQKSPNRLDAMVWGLTWLMSASAGSMSTPGLKLY